MSFPRFHADPEPDDYDELDPDPEGEEFDSEEPQPEEDGPQADVQRRVSREVNRVKSQMGQARQQERQALRQNGLDVVDGRVVVVNEALFTGYLQASGKGEPTPQRQEEPQEEELGAAPDPTMFPDEHAEWQQKREDQIERRLERKLAKKYEQQLAAQTEQLKHLQAPVQRREFEAAVSIAERVLPQYGLDHLLDHPEFEQHLHQALVHSGQPVEAWSDPKLLARIGGILNVDMPQPRRQRNPNADEEPYDRPRRRGERYPEEDPQARRVSRPAISREAARAYGPSRSGGRRSDPVEPASREDRSNAQRLGVSLEEYRMLADPLGREYIAHEQAKQRGRAGGKR